MLLTLQKYDVTMTYMLGKYMFAAETLSCANENADKENSADIQAYVDMIVTTLPESDDRKELIRQESESD